MKNNHAMSNIRQSNFELLRIISMFLVLFVHANFISLGAPSIRDLQVEPFSTLFRLFMESMCVCCVNVFVLISGYFSIHPTNKGMLKYLFQCLFFSISIYIVCSLMGLSELNFRGICQSLFISQDYWFVKAYLGLYILSPIINSFVENSSRNIIRKVLILFFVYQTSFGWLYPSTNYFSSGYSLISFLGLYLLARYIKQFPCKIKSLSVIKAILFFIFCVSIVTVMSILSLYKLPVLITYVFAYSNPLVILSSICLIVLFSKFKLSSRFINRIAKHSFAVYLFHSHFNILIPVFSVCILWIYNETRGLLTILLIFLFCIGVFILSVLMDIIRSFIWSKLEMKIRRCQIFNNK